MYFIDRFGKIRKGYLMGVEVRGVGGIGLGGVGDKLRCGFFFFVFVVFGLVVFRRGFFRGY